MGDDSFVDEFCEAFASGVGLDAIIDGLAHDSDSADDGGGEGGESEGGESEGGEGEGGEGGEGGGGEGGEGEGGESDSDGDDEGESDAGGGEPPQCAKEDLVLVARLRQLSYTDADLWRRSGGSLLLELEPRRGEYAAVRAAQQARAAFLAERKAAGQGCTADALRAALRAAGRPAPAGVTKGGLADLLLEGGGPPPPIVLDPDQAAAVERHGARRLMIYAGPGAGKTTTVCHIVGRICADPRARVLVLAYNRCARASLAKRIRMLGVKAIGRPSAASAAACGALVLTFDTLCATAQNDFDGDWCGGFEGGVEACKSDSGGPAADSYSLNVKRGVAAIRRQGWAWDAVVVDEAQDVLGPHAAVIDALLAGRGRPGGPPGPRLVAAGDPRQELYQGARWFSARWAEAPAGERAVLRYNHRSAPEVVAALNAFSRANFPTLHCDQIACRPAGGRVEVVAVGAPAGWQYRADARAESARAVGEAVGALLADAAAGEAYAVSPVSVQKYGAEAATNTARQAVAERRPGVLVHAGDFTLEACAGVYLLATSRKIKGTERGRVVVYGADVNFVGVERADLVKLLFVALSRARDELFVVLRREGDAGVAEILAPVVAGRAGAAAPARAEARRPPVVAVADAGGGRAEERGLAGSPALRAAGRRCGGAPRIELGPARADADFMGVFAEALVAEAFGAPLASAGAVAVCGEPEALLRGLYRRGGGYEIRVAPGAVAGVLAAARAVDAGGAAYRHACLRYVAQVGRPWTVSERFAAGWESAAAAAADVAAWIRAETGKAQFAYHVRGRHALPLRRALGAAGEAEPGSVAFEVDLVADGGEGGAGGTPVELKFVEALSDCHRRQVAAYAALLGAERGLLVNLREGAAEWVPAAPLRLVEDVGRALVTLREARRLATGPLGPRCVGAPAGLATECLVSVDVETDFSGRVVELSAVAFSADSWAVLGVFDARAAGVSEVPQPRYPAGQRGAPPLLELTGLRLDGAAVDGDELTASFLRWCDALPFRKTCLHYGGREKELFGGAMPTVDVLRAVFKPWLDAGRSARGALCSLEDAARQFGLAHMPHRAIEDAIAAAGVFAACVRFGTL